MALFPADARVAGMIDLQDLQTDGGIAFSSERGLTFRFMDSDVTFNPLSNEQQDRLEAFIDATGFEPGADLHAVYVASDSLHNRTILLAADIDRDRLFDHLEAEFGDHVATTTHQDVPIVTIQQSGDHEGFQLALLDDGWIALGSDAAALQTVIDRSQEARSTSADYALSELTHQIAGRGGAWIIARDLPLQNMAQMTDERRMRLAAQSVRDAATALNFEDDGVAGTALLTTDQDADDLADVLRGLVSAVKMREDLSEEQRRLLDRVAITTQGDYVMVDFTIDQATLARLLIDTMQSSDKVAGAASVR